MSRTVGAIVAFVFRYAFLGMLLGLVFILPWKILQMAQLDALYMGLFERLGLPRIIGHLLTLAISLVIVALAGWLVFQALRSHVQRYPTIAWLLRTLENATAVFRKTSDGGKARVVIIQWPRPDVQTVGILVRHIEGDSEGERKAVVYLPNTPNPLSGMTRIVDLDQITETDWSIQDLLAFSITRGAAIPEELE